jgi:Methyltransferase domain
MCQTVKVESTSQTQSSKRKLVTTKYLLRINHTVKTTFKGWLRRKINILLGVVGLALVPVDQDDAIRSFLPFKETLAAAQAASLSLGDYVESQYSQPGSTQNTIEQMRSMGVFQGRIERVCEIGPGSGRYLERIIQACHPSYYEIYEPAPEWSDWLTQTYKVTAHPSDGVSLAYTPDHSIDLVHAHRVLVYLPFFTSCRYLVEMARVVADGGQVVFDIITDECMDIGTLDKYITSDIRYSNRCVMPKQYAVALLSREGLSLDGSFFVPLSPGKAQYLVFSKPSA